MIAVAWWHHDLCVCTFCLRSGNFLFSQDHRSRRGSNFITARTDFSDDLVFVFRITLRTREKDNFFFENSSSKVTAKSSIFVSLNHFSTFRFSFLFFHTVRTRRINKRRSVDHETPMPIMNTIVCLRIPRLTSTQHRICCVYLRLDATIGNLFLGSIMCKI